MYWDLKVVAVRWSRSAEKPIGGKMGVPVGITVSSGAIEWKTMILPSGSSRRPFVWPLFDEPGQLVLPVADTQQKL